MFIKLCAGQIKHFCGDIAPLIYQLENLDQVYPLLDSIN